VGGACRSPLLPPQPFRRGAACPACRPRRRNPARRRCASPPPRGDGDATSPPRRLRLLRRPVQGVGGCPSASHFRRQARRRCVAACSAHKRPRCDYPVKCQPRRRPAAASLAPLASAAQPRPPKLALHLSHAAVGATMPPHGAAADRATPSRSATLAAPPPFPPTLAARRPLRAHAEGGLTGCTPVLPSSLPPLRRCRPPPLCRGARAAAVVGREPDPPLRHHRRLTPYCKWTWTGPALRCEIAPRNPHWPPPPTAVVLPPGAGAPGRPGPARSLCGRGGTRAGPAGDAGHAAADRAGGPASLQPLPVHPAADTFVTPTPPVRQGYRLRGGHQHRRPPRRHKWTPPCPPSRPRLTAAARNAASPAFPRPLPQPPQSRPKPSHRQHHHN